MNTMPCNPDHVNTGANFQLAYGSAWVTERTPRRVIGGTLSGVPYVSMDSNRGYSSNYHGRLMAQIFPDLMTMRRPERAHLAVQYVLRGILSAAVTSKELGTQVYARFVKHTHAYQATGTEYGCPQGVELSHGMVKTAIEGFVRLGWAADVSNPRFSLLLPLDSNIPADLVGTHVKLPSPCLIRVNEVNDEGFRKKSSINYELAATAGRRFSDLNEINVMTQQHTYGVVIDRVYYPLDSTDAAYHCVYNSSNLDKGGRLYCNLQNLPSRARKIRQALMIDGCPTVELDYSNMHIRMLYARKGIEYTGDCYDIDIDIPGWSAPPEKRRSLLKVLLLALPNCGSPDKDPKANRRSAINTSSATFQEWKKTNPYPLPKGVTITTILDRILAHHAPIADCFFTGQGVYLQTIDAQIACEILLTCARANKACVGVHDSFIVKEQDAEFLIDLMDRTYRKYINAAPVIDGKVRPAGTYSFDYSAPLQHIHFLQHA
jgi:hypothetical protein